MASAHQFLLVIHEFFNDGSPLHLPVGSARHNILLHRGGNDHQGFFSSPSVPPAEMTVFRRPASLTGLLKDWSVDQLALALDEAGLGKLAPHIQREDIDGRSLLTTQGFSDAASNQLIRDFLAAIDVSLGLKLRFLRWCGEFCAVSNDELSGRPTMRGEKFVLSVVMASSVAFFELVKRVGKKFPLVSFVRHFGTVQGRGWGAGAAEPEFVPTGDLPRQYDFRNATLTRFASANSGQIATGGGGFGQNADSDWELYFESNIFAAHEAFRALPKCPSLNSRLVGPCQGLLPYVGSSLLMQHTPPRERVIDWPDRATGKLMYRRAFDILPLLWRKQIMILCLIRRFTKHWLSRFDIGLLDYLFELMFASSPGSMLHRPVLSPIESLESGHWILSFILKARETDPPRQVTRQMLAAEGAEKLGENFSLEELNRQLESLLAEGRIYTNIDDDHFSLTTK